MRSVYIKISLWSFAVLLCSSVLFVVIARNNVSRSFSKEGELGHRLVSQMEAARRVYENEGKEGLARHLELLVVSYPGFEYHLGTEGRDLVTGEDLSRLYAQSRSRWQIYELPAPI